MTTRIATCTCGQLRIVVAGPTLGIGICHCLACQSRTGSVFAALAAFAPPWTVTGTATEYVRTGDRGGRARFRFCPVCGSTVFHTGDGDDREVMVAVGCFGDRSFPPPQDLIYDQRRHPWVALPASVVEFDGDPP